MRVRRKNLNFAGFLVCLIFCLSLLAGCDGDMTPTPAGRTPTNSTATGKATPNPYPVALNPKISALPLTELQVWFAEDYYNQPPIVDLVKEFSSAYPNIKIKMDTSEWGAMKDKIKDAIKQNKSPDLVHQHSFVMGAQGYAQPLNDLWQQWDSTARGRLLPGAIEEVSWRANFYGVPLDINAAFLIYNKAMFKEAGLPEPDANYTYPKLLEDAKKLTKADGSRYGVGIYNAPWNTYAHIRSVGGRLLEQTGGNLPLAQLDSDANIKMLDFMAALVNKDKVSPMPPIAGRYDLVDLFMQRKIAMFFSGPWDLTIMQQKGPSGLYEEVGTAGMPRGFDGKTNGSVQGGGSMFVPQGSKNREAAFELMKWAVSPKYQMRLAREMGRYPVLADLYKDPFFTSQPLLQPYLDLLNYSHPYDLEAYADADIVWDNAVKAIINEGKNARTTLQDANRTIDNVIKNKG